MLLHWQVEAVDFATQAFERSRPLPAGDCVVLFSILAGSLVAASATVFLLGTELIDRYLRFRPSTFRLPRRRQSPRPADLLARHLCRVGSSLRVSASIAPASDGLHLSLIHI